MRERLLVLLFVIIIPIWFVIGIPIIVVLSPIWAIIWGLTGKSLFWAWYDATEYMLEHIEESI